jgi:hypothetical protein
VIWIIVPLLLFVVFGHYVRRKAERLRAEEGAEVVRGSISQALQRPHVVVAIKLAGEGMATPDELHSRQALEDEIEWRGIGKVADAGSGKGVMHVIVVTADPERSALQVRELLATAGLLESAEVRAVTP